MKPRIYIAGPYTKGDAAENVRNAVNAADVIADIGGIPFCPHLNHFWHYLHPRDIDYWYQYDMEWLKLCHALYRLPGKSKGADAEVKEAKKRGFPVFEEFQDLVDWIGFWNRNIDTK